MRARVSNALSVIYTRLAFRPRYILDRNWKIKPAINKRVISGSQLDSDRPDMENDIPLCRRPVDRRRRHPPSETTIYTTLQPYHRSTPRSPYRRRSFIRVDKFYGHSNNQEWSFRRRVGIARRGGSVPAPAVSLLCEPITHKSLTAVPFSTIPLLL